MVNWLRKKRDDGSVTDCCPDCGCEVDTALTYCTACGYDIVKQARIDLTQQPRLP
jgi:hypothetical protein